MRRVASLAAAVVLAAGGCAREESGPRAGGPAVHVHGMPESLEPVDGKHRRLLEIARGLAESNDPYYGRIRFERMKRADAETMSPAERSGFYFGLSAEYFKFDNPAAAESLAHESRLLGKNDMALYMEGIAALRRGELANCLAMHNPESCLLPLEGRGVHADPEGAARAIPLFEESLKSPPQGSRFSARFLLNLAHMAVGDWPDGVPEDYRIDRPVFSSPGAVRRFRDRAAGLGMTVMNQAGGSAMDDFDGDGFLDIVTSTSWPTGPMTFYRNNGDGTFTDRTEHAGLTGQIGGLNLLHADFDGDGRLDLLVLRGGWLLEHGRQPRSLLHNVGDGRFVDVTREAGLDDAYYPSQTAAFSDYDLDGDLDLFVGNEALLREEMSYESVGFEISEGGDLAYPSQLFRNEGDGTFVDVAEAAGVTNLRYAKGCAWGDYDGDRHPDLYVSNMWGKNRLYHNLGDGTFRDVAPELGLEEPLFSFPVWFWDYDNDGRQDLFVASYRGTPSSVIRSYLRPDRGLGQDALYHNGEDGFRNLAKEAGLTTLTLTMGANFADVDGDGWLDMYHATGSPRFDALVPNVLYRANGHGGFDDETFSAGLGNLQKGHGVSFGDVDNDGDEDLFLQSGGFYAYDYFFNSLYENPGHGNRWITVLLEGQDSNRFGIGSRIRVTVEEDDGSRRDIYRWVGPAGSFGSSSVQQEIGLGSPQRIVRLEVWWPKTDEVQAFEAVEMDRFYEVREGVSRLEARERPVLHLGA